MATFFPSSGESCGSIPWPMPSSSGEERVYPSSPKKEKAMTMATFLPSSREEKVCPSSPNKKREMTMAALLPFSVESCDGGHGLCHNLLEKRTSAPLVLRKRG